MIRIKKTNHEAVESSRIKYLDSLPVFQDVFLEFMVMESDCYQLFQDNQPIGYVLLSKDNILVEFYIEKKYAASGFDVFNLMVSEIKVKSVYCKSFDSRLLDCCLSNTLPYSIIGCLYRESIDTSIQRNSDLFFRYADSSDIAFLSQQDDEVFEPKHLLETFIQNKGILLLQLEDIIIGCGFLTQVHQRYNYYDIGVWVSPAHRMKGYATQIMLYLKELCLNNDWVPICGCDKQNSASQKMLNSLGFISNYKLIEFDTASLNR